MSESFPTHDALAAASSADDASAYTSEIPPPMKSIAFAAKITFDFTTTVLD